jgi:hypothetical protein
VGEARRTVAHQATFINVSGLGVDCGHFVMQRQGYNFVAMVEGKWKGPDHDCARPALDHGGKGCLEVGDVATFQDYDLSPQSLRCCHNSWASQRGFCPSERIFVQGSVHRFSQGAAEFRTGARARAMASADHFAVGPFWKNTMAFNGPTRVPLYALTYRFH